MVNIISPLVSLCESYKELEASASTLPKCTEEINDNSSHQTIV